MHYTCGTIGPNHCGCIKLPMHQAFEESFPCQDYDGRQWCGYCLKEACQHLPKKTDVEALEKLWGTQ